MGFACSAGAAESLIEFCKKYFRSCSGRAPGLGNLPRQKGAHLGIAGRSDKGFVVGWLIMINKIIN